MKSALAVRCLLAAASLFAATAQAGTVFNDSAQLDLSGAFAPVAAVNFYFNPQNDFAQAGTQVTGTIQGVAFINDNLVTAAPVSLPGGGTLTTALPNGTIADRAITSLTPFVGTAPDTAQAENLATALSYLAGGQTGSLDFAFGAGLANHVVAVQITGGDQGWTGTLTASGGGGSDSFSTNGQGTTAELLSFLATTDGTGHLNINLSVAGSYVGISGVIVSTPTPEPSSLALCGIGALALLTAARRRRAA